MNERIFEIIQEMNGRVGLQWDDEDKEELAELIVRECLEQIDLIRDGCEADNEGQQALGADWAGLAVARHFGVE